MKRWILEVLEQKAEGPKAKKVAKPPGRTQNDRTLSSI